MPWPGNDEGLRYHYLLRFFTAPISKPISAVTGGLAIASALTPIPQKRIDNNTSNQSGAATEKSVAPTDNRGWESRLNLASVTNSALREWVSQPA